MRGRPDLGRRLDPLRRPGERPADRPRRSGAEPGALWLRSHRRRAGDAPRGRHPQAQGWGQSPRSLWPAPGLRPAQRNLFQLADDPAGLGGELSLRRQDSLGGPVRRRRSAGPGRAARPLGKERLCLPPRRSPGPSLLTARASSPGHVVSNQAGRSPETKGASPMARYGKTAQKKVEKVMRERKRGTLRSGGSGKKVTSRKQAIAIGLSEARRAGAKVPRKRVSGKR